MNSYYPEERNWKKRYEATIPIILLILVIVAAAWKMGWLPLDALFGRGAIDVLIVGEDQEVANILDQVRIGRPINYRMLNMEDVEEIQAATYLEKYDIIILTEKLGEEPGDLPGTFRSHVSRRLGQGADLVLYGVAGSRDPEDPNTDGWIQFEMDRFIPVTCPAVGVPCESNKETYSGTISSLSMTNEGYTHPILKQFGTQYNFDDEEIVEYERINTVRESKILANIKINVAGSPTNPAIVQRDYGVARGKAIYFAYHPAKTPVIFKNTLEYLAG